MTITESAIRTSGAPAVGLLPHAGARPISTGRRQVRTTPDTVSPRVVLGVLVLVVTQAVGAVEALRAMADAPIVMAAPLVMAAVALARLRMPVPGPPIHDRQLDLIISLGAGLTACALVATQMTGHGHELALLAMAPTAVAVLGAVVGTRTLWHLRAVPALLAMAWPAPWEAVLAHFGPASPAQLAVPLGVGVIAAAIALVGGRPSATTPAARQPLFPLPFAAQP